MLGLIAAIAVSVSVPNSSQMTLGDLNVLCGQEKPGDACRFYTLGVVEGVSLATGVATDSKHFCTPDGVTQTEIVAIVKRLAAADLAHFPEDETMPAVSFIGAALASTYPCHLS